MHLVLPCNVIVYVNDAGETVVAAVDPVASMQAVEKFGPERSSAHNSG